MADSTKQDSLSMATLEKEWMVTAAVINNNPDLIAAFNKIMGIDANGNKVSGAITDPGLQAQIIQGTSWYRNQTDAQRKFDYAKATNPGQFAADLQSNAANIIRQFAANGITITAQEAVDYAQNMMKQSVIVNGKVVKYDQNYLNQLMANSIDFSKTGTVGGTKDPKTGKVTGGTTVYTNITGKMETLAQQLYQTAWDYGFPASTSQAGFEDWFQSSLKGLVAGTLTNEKLDDMLQQRAISMFPGLANQITQGQTLRKAADPWLNAIADTWEVDQNTLDLNNDYVQKALNFQDEKGNITPMNLYDAKKLARRSGQWDYTQTAKEEKTKIASSILRDFGFLG
jgi:regulatory protein YycI of two-component signal transduction system YycFG